MSTPMILSGSPSAAYGPLNRLVNKAAWFLAERAHAKRLGGAAHLALFADLWELAAAGIVEDQMRAMRGLGVTPAPGPPSPVNQAMTRIQHGQQVHR